MIGLAIIAIAAGEYIDMTNRALVMAMYMNRFIGLVAEKTMLLHSGQYFHCIIFSHSRAKFLLLSNLSFINPR